MPTLARIDNLKSSVNTYKRLRRWLQIWHPLGVMIMDGIAISSVSITLAKSYTSVKV